MLCTDVEQQRWDAKRKTLSRQHRQALLDVAEAAIREGFRSGGPLTVDLRAFPADLREPRATFVTLHIGDDLRGCIGTIEAVRPLVEEVAHNAFNAAFDDPRFPPLRTFEYPLLDIDISILSPMESIVFTSNADLLEQIRPGIDGLELECGPYRGLLLPTCWKQLPDRSAFYTYLKLKAGLPSTFWSRRMRVNRFTTELIRGRADKELMSYQPGENA